VRTAAAIDPAKNDPAKLDPPKSDPAQSPSTEPDLIDRIALALPEEIRAEYYRELLHCRSLPESDEMLRLLRAMQFLVLLIEQAPSRVADERERLDKLLATAIGNMSKISTTTETYHIALERRLNALPAEVADGIRPEAIAGQINESLRQEFLRSTIPQTADAIAVVADRMKHVCSDFTVAADGLGHTYRGVAKEAQKAVASLKTEISQATDNAARFTTEVSETFSRAYRWMMFVVAGGALVIGLALGMMFERFLFSPPKTVAEPAAPVVQVAPPPAGSTTPPGANTAPKIKSKTN
jgi:hypothetical protein